MCCKNIGPIRHNFYVQGNENARIVRNDPVSDKGRRSARYTSPNRSTFDDRKFMSEPTAVTNAYIDVAFSNRPALIVPITEVPFFIGRGRENGNHLSIDDIRISRKSLVIGKCAFGLLAEDNGRREGIFVNGEAVKSQPLAHGDRIRLGIDDGCQLIFRVPPERVAPEDHAPKLQSMLGSMGDDSSRELDGLKLLLEATSLMRSRDSPTAQASRTMSPFWWCDTVAPAGAAMCDDAWTFGCRASVDERVVPSLQGAYPKHRCKVRLGKIAIRNRPIGE